MEQCCSSQYLRICFKNPRWSGLCFVCRTQTFLETVGAVSSLGGLKKESLYVHTTCVFHLFDSPFRRVKLSDLDVISGPSHLVRSPRRGRLPAGSRRAAQVGLFQVLVGWWRASSNSKCNWCKRWNLTDKLSDEVLRTSCLSMRRSRCLSRDVVELAQGWEEVIVMHVPMTHTVTRKVLGTVGVVLQKKCIQHGVGSGETTPLVTAHNTGNTSQSTLQNFSVASAAASSALGLYPCNAGEKPCARRTGITRSSKGSTFGHISREDRSAKQSQQRSYHNKITSCETATFGHVSWEDPVQSNLQNNGVPKKEAERIEFEKLPKSNSFVI